MRGLPGLERLSFFSPTPTSSSRPARSGFSWKPRPGRPWAPRHLYARSSLGSTDSAGRRRASRDLYVRRRYGRFGARLLDAAGRLARPVIVERMDEPRAARREGAWIAISPNPSLLPFVGAPLDEDFQLPPETLAPL